jgi:protein-tyrosine phosphatase
VTEKTPQIVSEPRTLLFVCTGNTCRSPMAEHLFRKRVGPASVWRSGSAGLMAMEGASASPEAIEAMREEKIDLRDHRSRRLTPELVRAADLVVVMTGRHRADLLRCHPDAAGKTRLMTSFGEGEPADIADPIGSDVWVYRRVRDQLESAVANLILYLCQTWGAPAALSPENNS